MGLGECALKGRPTVSARAEADKLVGVLQIGAALEIVPLQPSDIHQHLPGRRLASGEREFRSAAIAAELAPMGLGMGPPSRCSGHIPRWYGRSKIFRSWPR